MVKEAPELPAIGARADLVVDLDETLLDRFVAYGGDRNPLHLDDTFARERGFPGRVAHGMSYAAHLSTLIGMHLPGPGALWASQTIRFVAPAFPGDSISLSATVVGVNVRARTVRLSVRAVNRAGRLLMEGESEVLVPRSRDEVESAPSPHAAKASSDTGARRVALIAGASGDLGGAIARSLAHAGFLVALCGRNDDRLRAIASEVAELAPGSHAVQLNLSDDHSVDAAMTAIERDLGVPSIIVHSASAPLERLGIDDTAVSHFANHVEVQAYGLLRLLRRGLGGMRALGGGHIVYIGSTATRGAPPKGLAAYAAAKAAAASLIRSIALECAPFGIRANIVAPHFLPTHLNAHVSEKSRMLTAAQTPLRRLARLDEIAAGVAFLVSDGGSFVNGHELVVDGGATMG